MKVFIDQRDIKKKYTVISFAIVNNYKVYTLRDESGNTVILDIELEF
jgi:hypothetical protein